MNCQLLAQQWCHVNSAQSQWCGFARLLTHIQAKKLCWGGNQNGPENGDSTQEDLVSLNSYFTQSIVAQIEPKLVRSEIRMSKKRVKGCICLCHNMKSPLTLWNNTLLSVSHHEESVDTLKQYIDTESVFEQTSAIYIILSFDVWIQSLHTITIYMPLVSFSGWNWPLCYVCHCLVWFSIPDCNNSWSTRHPGSIPDQHISNKQLFINHKLCNNGFTYW